LFGLGLVCCGPKFANKKLSPPASNTVRLLSPFFRRQSFQLSFPSLSRPEKTEESINREREGERDERRLGTAK